MSSTILLPRSLTLRFHRAEKHIKTLESEVVGFGNRHPHHLLTEIDAQCLEYTFRIRIREQPPDYLPTIASDAIHNLRSLLDNVAFFLAGMPRNPRIAQRIEFPIIRPGPLPGNRRGGRRAFDEAIKNKLIRVPRKALAVIERAQPYHGYKRFRTWLPPHPLSILQDLSNLDKHRILHFTYFVAARFTAQTTEEPIRREINFGPLEDNAVVARYWFSQPDVKVYSPTAEFVLVADVRRRQGSYLRIPIVPYLNGILRFIYSDIFVPLEPLFRQR